MTNMNQYFILYSHVYITKGKYRSLIIDTKSRKYYKIPNDLYHFLTVKRNTTLNDILTEYDEDDVKIINEYYEFLLANSFGTFVANIENFPIKSYVWDSPYKITNSIIDINSINIENNLAVISQLNDVNCKFLQIRTFEKIDVSFFFSQLIKNISDTDIIYVEVLLKYDVLLDYNLLSTVIDNQDRILTVYIHSTPDHFFNSMNKNNYHNIHHVLTEVTSEKCCGSIAPSNFSITPDHIHESKMFNTCLNRKIAIDVLGNIRKCPSLAESYGNINNTLLNSVINLANFKKYDTINKNTILICKDCEFREICTDCRAYLEDPTDLLSKPLKCGYDLINGVWRNWEENILKIDAINHYGMNK